MLPPELLRRGRSDVPGKEFRCFFDFTFGKEFYSETENQHGIDTEPLILKTGFGFQMLKSKWWALELKIGFGNRNDFRNDMDRKYLVPDLELSFYRVIWKNS